MIRKRFTLTLILILVSVATTTIIATAQSATSGVLVVRLEGVISGASVEAVSEAIAEAMTRGEFIILAVDTPGGSLDSTFQIVDLIEGSSVPVIGFVYPPGAEAWSAGTYILMSTHIAAMAPNTIIGSAQPVSLDPATGGSTPITDSKTINALSKYMGERARAHNRNGTVAELFVTENLNLNDEEALTSGVIELRATSIEDLLPFLDGQTVTVDGVDIILDSSGDSREYNPSLRLRLLSLITDPILAYLLLIIGVWVFIAGLGAPGAGAEVVGGVMALLGLIGLGLFGVNTGGLILLLVGLILILAEIFIEGFGPLGIGGVICLLLGGLLLFPAQWSVSEAWLDALILVLIVVPLTLGSLFLLIAWKVLGARRRKPVGGSIIGAIGVSEDGIEPDDLGYVTVDGEVWRARSPKHVARGQRIAVVGKEGPLLVVEPIGVTDKK